MKSNNAGNRHSMVKFMLTPACPQSFQPFQGGINLTNRFSAIQFKVLSSIWENLRFTGLQNRSKKQHPMQVFPAESGWEDFQGNFFVWSNHFISHHWNPPHHGEFIDMSDIQRLSCNIRPFLSFSNSLPSSNFHPVCQRNMVSCSCCSCSFSGAASKVASIFIRVEIIFYGKTCWLVVVDGFKD